MGIKRVEDALPRQPAGGPIGGGRYIPFDPAFARNGTRGRPTEVLFSSESRRWGSIFLSQQCEAPFQANFEPIAHHLMVLHLSGTVRVNGLFENRRQSRLVRPGGLSFWPGGIRFGVELEQQLNSLHVYINADLMADVVRSFGLSSADPGWLRPIFAQTDDLLEQLAVEALNTARADWNGAEIYAEHVARAIASRLIWISRHGLRKHEPVREEGLRQHQFKQLYDYVECNLERNLQLHNLSSVVGLSVSHFSRQFKATSGVTPHQFVLKRRLERAKRLLRNTANPIAQVALESGFSHQEHLTHSFRRLVGMTPAEFRRRQQ